MIDIIDPACPREDAAEGVQLGERESGAESQDPGEGLPEQDPVGGGSTAVRLRSVAGVQSTVYAFAAIGTDVASRVGLLPQAVHAMPEHGPIAIDLGTPS